MQIADIAGDQEAGDLPAPVVEDPVAACQPGLQDEDGVRDVPLGDNIVMRVHMLARTADAIERAHVAV